MESSATDVCSAAGNGTSPAVTRRKALLRCLRVVEALVVLPVLVLLSLLPLVRPSTDGSKRADAVVVLSGDYGERRALAMSLVDKGLVPALVFVGTPDRGDEEPLCQSRQSIEYICLRPQPDNTRAEARAVSLLAKERHWDTIVVVTSKYHVTRSRLLFRRCFNGDLRMMGGDPPYERSFLVRQIRLEWLKVMYTVVQGPDC